MEDQLNIAIIDEQELLDLKEKHLLDNELYKLLHISPFGATIEFKINKDENLKVLFIMSSAHFSYDKEVSGDSIDSILDDISMDFMKALKKWKSSRFEGDQSSEAKAVELSETQVKKLN